MGRRKEVEAAEKAEWLDKEEGRGKGRDLDNGWAGPCKRGVVKSKEVWPG